MASRFWILSNEDAKAPVFRKLYVEQNGGSWTKDKNGWTWTAEAAAVVKEEPKKKRKLFRKDA